jgi:PAS domain S-box-containing protein
MPGVFERISAMLQQPGTTVPLTRETFLRLNGEPVEVEAMAISFDDGGSTAIQLTFREVTRTVEMEDRLKRSEEIYRTIAESAADIICIVDPDSHITYANTACARMFGCSPDELAGRRLEELAPPEMARRHHENVLKVISSGMPLEHVEEFPTPAGVMRLDIKLSPIKGPDGSVVSVVAIARDITHRERRP